MIRCGTLPYRFGSGDKRHPKHEGFLNINVCSSGRRFHGLSPMKIGPLEVTEILFPTLDYPDGIHPGFEAVDDTYQVITASNFENSWQFMKVYNIDFDDEGYVTRSFFERRAKGYSDPKPHRRAIPKNKGYPVCSFFNGKFMPYLEARIKYYCKYYASIVAELPEYQELEDMLGQGINLHIIGYDGRDVPITKESMEDEILRTDIPFGHELVLCCMLSGLYPWEDPHIIELAENGDSHALA